MSTDITVIEVYESAAEIGKDLERLIDAVGSDLVVELMPKVIRILEQLESCVKQRENGVGKLQNMQDELRRMKHVGAVASEENLRVIMDVKQLDAQRQKEIRDWMAMAKELEQQNRRLKAQLSEKEGIVDREKAHEQEALQVLYQLKETVDNQREQLRAKNDELKTRALEVDALQQHVDRLAKVTADLRRKNELLGTMARNFIQEKSELQSELRAMGKETLPEHHGIASREAVDGGRQQQSAVNGAAESDTERQEIVPAASIVAINAEGKAIIDLSDPNRPRFTLRELQIVLQERDELKLDIMELEDELQQYRPKEEEAKLSEADQRQQRSDSNASKTKGEPSGIKKLFSFLFRGKNGTKPSTATEDEGAWEFLEKPHRPAGEGLTVTEPDPRVRANTVGPPIPEESPALGEVAPGKDTQRRRSYTGPFFQVTHKEPFKQRERMTCVRTDSKQLVELGQDIVSVTGPNLINAPAVSANVAMGQPTVSCNNSNSNSGKTNSTVIEQLMMADQNAAGKEVTCQKASAAMPKILINNNDGEETEVEI